MTGELWRSLRAILAGLRADPVEGAQIDVRTTSLRRSAAHTLARKSLGGCLDQNQGGFDPMSVALDCHA
jgi:hypothetical protein